MVYNMSLKKRYLTVAFILGSLSVFCQQQFPIQVESDENFVKVEEYQVSGAQPDTRLVTEKKISYQYFDGLGRPIQTVQEQADPP